ncbi:MAG: hypothetical protein HDR01_03945 [Lachnospiraceae bacterium]|nr:hypothetical protein [Lachnospiraceae bacterium]
MKLKKKRWFPVTLALWPYLYDVLLWPVAGDDVNEILVYTFFILSIIITIVVYVLNMIYACTCREEDSYYHLAFWNMLIKLIHIPVYLTILLIDFILALCVVVPVFIFMSPFLILYFFFVALFLMIASSAYGVNALIRAGMKRVVSKKYVVINIILHFFFVADVISAIVLYIKVRKEKRKREQKELEAV